MPIDLRPPERRVPRTVDHRTADRRARDEKNESFLIKLIAHSWLLAALALLAGCIVYIPVAWALHFFS